ERGRMDPATPCGDRGRGRGTCRTRRRGRVRCQDACRNCRRRAQGARAAMSGIVATGEKRLVLASGRPHPVLPQEAAAELGVEVLPMDAWDFANGEIYVRYGESVRGTDVFVLQSHPAPINTWVMEHLIMIDALKRASAKRITAIAPSFPYARQDKKHRGREPI